MLNKKNLIVTFEFGCFGFEFGKLFFEFGEIKKGYLIKDNLKWAIRDSNP